MLFDIVPELYLFVMPFDAVPDNVIWYTSSNEILRTFVSRGSYILLPCNVFDIVPQVNYVVMLFDRMIYVICIQLRIVVSNAIYRTHDVRVVEH